MKETADVLAESREYIEKNGWWVGSLLSPYGSAVCSVGAIALSQGWWSPITSEIYFSKRDQIDNACAAVLKVVRPDLVLEDEHYASSELASWNDGAAGNKQAVLDAFMAAEKLARSGNVED